MNGGFPPIVMVKEKQKENKKEITKVSAYQLPTILNIKDILKEKKADFKLDDNEDKLEVIKSF